MLRLFTKVVNLLYSILSLLVSLFENTGIGIIIINYYLHFRVADVIN